MEQKTHQNKVESIRKDLISNIRKRIGVAGVNSKVNNDMSLIIKPGFDSASVGYTIKEVQFNQMIDERGLYYDYEALTTDELAELTDMVKA